MNENEGVGQKTELGHTTGPLSTLRGLPDAPLRRSVSRLFSCEKRSLKPPRRPGRCMTQPDGQTCKQRTKLHLKCS